MAEVTVEKERTKVVVDDDVFMSSEVNFQP